MATAVYFYISTVHQTTEPVLFYSCLWKQMKGMGSYPSRVCSDPKGKNVDVAQLMLMLCDPHRGSHITGRLVNNIQMESWLWPDVLTQCVSILPPFLLSGRQWHSKSKRPYPLVCSELCLQ